MNHAPEPPLFARPDNSSSSQTEKAYGALEEMIVTGELPPGSQWSETALSERIHIGRTPTREALQRLEFQGLVSIAPRHGVFVSQIDYHGQLKLIAARREIERLIVAEAAQYANPTERAELEAIATELQALKQNNDMRGYMRQHFLLTRCLGAAARNYYAAEFYATLQTLARRFLYFHQNQHSSFAEILDLHIRQIRAILAGDREQAVAISAARSDYAENLTKGILMDKIANASVTIQVVDGHNSF